MKNKKMVRLSVVAAVVVNMGAIGFANAQIVSKQPAVGYSGLSYPDYQTSTDNRNNVPGINSLMSSQITSGQTKDKDSITELRREAIKEIAGSLGASNGLAYRMSELKAETNSRANDLDSIFDFTKTTIDNGVLAPVITEGLSNYAQNSDDQVRIADKIYKIEAPAKFVSVYPTWRSYLRFTFPSFESPVKAYLPQNDTEKVIWDAAVKEGWDRGVTQANRIYENSYSRLERDYLGMIKYKISLAQGLITPTIIAKQNLGVTGGGREMSINDQVFRITDHSALNPNNKEWNVEYPITNKVDGKLK